MGLALKPCLIMGVFPNKITCGFSGVLIIGMPANQF